MPVMDLYYSKEKKAILVVHPFVSSGSLKDRIYRACPTKPYKDKYRMDRGSPLPLGEIAVFGAQILDALLALRSKGIVCEHLSSGNILIEQGKTAR